LRQNGGFDKFPWNKFLFAGFAQNFSAGFDNHFLKKEPIPARGKH